MQQQSTLNIYSSWKPKHLIKAYSHQAQREIKKSKNKRQASKKIFAFARCERTLSRQILLPKLFLNSSDVIDTGIVCIIFYGILLFCVHQMWFIERPGAPCFYLVWPLEQNHCLSREKLECYSKVISTDSSQWNSKIPYSLIHLLLFSVGRFLGINLNIIWKFHALKVFRSSQVTFANYQKCKISKSVL